MQTKSLLSQLFLAGVVVLEHQKDLGLLHVRRWWLLGKPLNRLSRLLMLLGCLTVNNVVDVIYVAVCSGQKKVTLVQIYFMSDLKNLLYFEH